MSVFKCKMCGGDLEITDGVSVCECEYCGTKQTVPLADNEKKITLFGRANRLRFNNEFDKAAGVYESIVADFPEEAEAYWGLVLCKYGIEYVDDPATSKKIPTCHRSSFESVMDDSNYEQALENADALARGVYREEAKQIEELRKGIIEVSSKEEPYDIFICYKETAENGDRTIDSVIAQDVYNALIEKGYRVFFSRISLEDKLGVEYEPYIFAALNSAKVMLAFGTDYEYYNAVWVKNEWSRFLQLIVKGEKKTLIPCYKDIDAYDMPKEFAKLQAQDMGKVGAIQDLLRGIEKILPKSTKGAEPVIVQQSVPFAPGVDSLLERAFMFLEDGKWDDANTYCDKVLDIDPKCARAYLGKLMAELNVDKQENLSNSEKPFDQNSNYQKAIRFGDEKLVTYLSVCNDTVKKHEEEKRIAKENETAKNRIRLADIREKIKPVQSLVSLKDNYTLAVKCDGEAIVTGSIFSINNVKDWTDIIAVSSGVSSGRIKAIGLKSNGTVVTAVKDDWLPFIRNWTDIIAVSTGYDHIIGLKSDGTVLSMGSNKYGQCNVDEWTNIVAVSAGSDHTLGLRSNGTVVAVGRNDFGQCNVSEWEDIVSVSAGTLHTVGLKSNGIVVATGNDHFNGFNMISSWTDIVAISAGSTHTVGLKANGTVVVAAGNWKGEGNIHDWTNIVAVFAGDENTVGLKSDGTMVSVGKNSFNRLNVFSFKLFDSIDTFVQERKKCFENKNRRIEEEKKQVLLENERKKQQFQLQTLRRQKGLCPYCGGEFKKGLFSTKCVSCGKSKDY